MAIDGPYLVHSQAHECNDVLRHSIAVRLHLNEQQMLVTSLRNRKAFVAYDPLPTAEAEENFASVCRSQFNNLTHFYLNVPSTEACNLEYVGIPSYEAQLNVELSIAANAAGSDVVDAMLMNSPNSQLSSCSQVGDSNANHTTSAAGILSLETNSEDSSLSDGDRTLVECVQQRGGGDSSPAFSSCGSRSPQLSQMSGQDDEEQRGESASRIQSFINGPSIASSSSS